MSSVCRICLQEDHAERMVSPCMCTGSQKYVHQSCLNSLFNIAIERMFENSSDSENLFNCQVCKTQLDLSYFNSTERRRIKFSGNFWNFFKIHTGFLYFLLFHIAISVYYGDFLLLFMTIAISVYGMGNFIKHHGLQFNFKEKTVDVVRYGLPIKDLKTGTIIRATSQNPAGMYKHAVAVIIECSSEKTLALALNKSINYSGIITKHFGGSDQLEKTFVLHTCSKVEGTIQITDDVFFGGNIQDFQSIGKMKVIQGCAEWIPGQLEGEIADGYWEIDKETKHISNFLI